jgi:hypothetical protein
MHGMQPEGEVWRIINNGPYVSVEDTILMIKWQMPVRMY